MNICKILKTAEKAKSCNCPFDKIYCEPYNCMAWVEYYPKIERENHSDADKLMLNEAIKRCQRVKKSGNGCTGILSLDALGFCSKLHKLPIEE